MPNQFVLNGANHDGIYSLSLFDSDGYPSPFAPVVSAANSGGASHIAWPSGMRTADGGIRLFGHRHVGGAFSDLGVWEIPPSGGAAEFKGVALSMIEGEIGIGPSTLFYESGAARPWKIICCSRKPGDDLSQAFLASSVTGAASSWQRDGVVVTVTQPWESNACSNCVVWLPEESKWALFSGTAVSFASNIGDVFADKVQVMFGNGLVHDVIAAPGGPNSATVTGTVRLNEPHCIFNPATGSGAPIYPVKQVGNRVYFDRQLTTDYSGGKLAHFGRYAYGVKHVWRKADGTFGAYATCQQMTTPENPSILAEYVAEMQAPAIRGPWTFVQRDIVFKPWNGSNYASCENPAPILVGE
jgi:hypothetical protein